MKNKEKNTDKTALGQHSVHGAMAGFAPLSRRGLLRTTVIAGAAFTTGCSRLFARRAAPENLKYKNLTEEEGRILEKLVRIIIPAERHGLPSSTGDIPTMHNLDDLAGDLPEQSRELLKLGLWFFEHRSTASFKLSRFTKMTDDEGLRYLQQLQEGAFFERGMATSIKTLVAVSYWRDPRTYDALGYEGPVTEKWRVQRIGNAPLPRG